MQVHASKMRSIQIIAQRLNCAYIELSSWDNNFGNNFLVRSLRMLYSMAYSKDSL
jgi:hypothetical protein